MRGCIVDLVVALLTLLSIVYILNPLWGVDFLPDNLPIVGNLDEAGATALLMACLGYYGVELGSLSKFLRSLAGKVQPKELPEAKDVDAKE